MIHLPGLALKDSISQLPRMLATVGSQPRVTPGIALIQRLSSLGEDGVPLAPGRWQDSC